MNKKNLLNTSSQKFVDLREEIRSIISNSGHCDPADLYPYLEKGNQDQIVILNTIWGWMYPNGRENHIAFGSSNNTVKNQNSTTELPNMTSDSNVIKTEAITEVSTELPNMSPNSNVIETVASTELPNISPDSNVIETEAPKNDMITVGFKTQDIQLNPKPNPRPKKTMTPRHKFKRIKKDGNVQKIQSPGVHKMKFKLSQTIADSQNTPIKSPNITCDFTVLDTGIPKSDSSKMVLEVQDTKQNHKTKPLKLSKGCVPQMPLVKRRKNVVKSGKFKSQGCIKRSSNLN